MVGSKRYETLQSLQLRIGGWRKRYQNVTDSYKRYAFVSGSVTRDVKMGLL